MAPSNVVIKTKPPGSTTRIDDAWQVVRQVNRTQGLLLEDRETFQGTYSSNTAYLALERRTDAVVGLAVVQGTGHIRLLAVHPDFQRRGIGQQLVEEVVDDHIAVSLHVRATNRRARRFYESVGFQEVAVKEDYYNDDVDGVLLEHASNTPIVGPLIVRSRGT